VDVRKPLHVDGAEDLYYQIEPLRHFDINSAEPIKIRPFKPKYHLTMGMSHLVSMPGPIYIQSAIQSATLSEFLEMDKTYLERIRLRKQLIEERPQDVMAANPIIGPAVLELYTWVVGTYLPQRFPTVYAIVTSSKLQSRPQLKNLATDSLLPLTASSVEEALRILGSNIDTDFLFLFPTSDPANGERYKLEGFITCFPSGFRTSSKLNMLLKDIHGPVPGYEEKLERSMDRFFATLPVGKIIKRVNWSITTTPDLFLLGGTHLTAEKFEEAATQQDKVDVEATVMRCERQTVHRLPKTKAIVFSYKTYQYSLKELKEEGCAEDLIRAIDGLGEGNVPGMSVYKRQVVWGSVVKDYLSS